MDSGREELMPRLLPVGKCDLTEDFDPAVPPRTPEEYLRRVQIEAARCPDVVIAQIDPKKLREKPTVSIAPSTEDEDSWKKFCLGERLYSDLAAALNTENRNPGIDYIKVGFPPLLSIVSRMSQATVTSVLEYLVNWFEEKEFTPELGRWLYALLASLEKPLLPEAHSLIRQLARRCSQVRADVEHQEDERVSALNLFICIVSSEPIFRQQDLHGFLVGTDVAEATCSMEN
ncbi:gem-associated protein 2 isoform X4 [Rhinoderma darwinii]|uniref:gem-associated protein 2 isoform X4 n=1 Tax=Rhinoderma darwinii TaxID=43563 RepID=UPI003F676CC9